MPEPKTSKPYRTYRGGHAGNDPEAVCPALKQAQAQGTKIVAFDSDVNCRQLFINQADTPTIGRSQMKLLGKLMGY